MRARQVAGKWRRRYANRDCPWARRQESPGDRSPVRAQSPPVAVDLRIAQQEACRVDPIRQLCPAVQERVAVAGQPEACARNPSAASHSQPLSEWEEVEKTEKRTQPC